MPSRGRIWWTGTRPGSRDQDTNALKTAGALSLSHEVPELGGERGPVASTRTLWNWSH